MLPNLVGTSLMKELVITMTTILDSTMIRRKRYGIELPQSAVRDDSPSTVNDPISSSNKGHQMLNKFGLREGDSLGAADNKGITEPVLMLSRLVNQSVVCG
ncbi:PREDICTED: angiogenic factor with G patch and FHA domains 1-like [Amphimedon queenslandica]|uniref:G-patch domain-containing protein n=1 Tax=Amphimedon queenslandica TaxID=400682 RepID=A0AAN0J9A9_AMPQE|nr:PREDICTED: angiogenic factor with G patch and FHA domains 1-like [Amphimedon queenslandica]|eukprot:XP_019853332.1 PREDICTED: angiogenic factor with G patch and FHA domains 1-like [Amphimedon queenslandica]